MYREFRNTSYGISASTCKNSEKAVFVLYNIRRLASLIFKNPHIFRTSSNCIQISPNALLSVTFCLVDVKASFELLKVKYIILPPIVVLCPVCFSPPSARKELYPSADYSSPVSDPIGIWIHTLPITLSTLTNPMSSLWLSRDLSRLSPIRNTQPSGTVNV